MSALGHKRTCAVQKDMSAAEQNPAATSYTWSRARSKSMSLDECRAMNQSYYSPARARARWRVRAMPPLRD